MVAWQQGVARYCSQYRSLLWRWQSGSFPILVCFFHCLQAPNACLYCKCSEMDICMNLVVKLPAVTIKRVCFFIVVSVFTLTHRHRPVLQRFSLADHKHEVLWVHVIFKKFNADRFQKQSHCIVRLAFWFGQTVEVLMNKQIKLLVILCRIHLSLDSCGKVGFFTFPLGMKTRSESQDEFKRRNTLYDWKQSTCQFLRVFLQLRHFWLLVCTHFICFTISEYTFVKEMIMFIKQGCITFFISHSKYF